MFDILENKAPKNAENISGERLQKIKTSVLSQVLQDKPDKEEKPMKKRTTFKALLVAAAVMTTGAISVIGASAEMNRTASEPITPPAQVDDATPAASAPAETPEVPETPETPETPEAPTDTETPESSYIPYKDAIETEINGYKVTIVKYEADGKPMKEIIQKMSDMELIDIEADGTHVYKTFSGGTFKAWNADGNYNDDSGWASIYYDF